MAAAADVDMEAVSPKNKTATFDEHIPSPPMGQGHMGSLLSSRTDPDAQTTVTDFLDFTEYLPSDMARSLTLIGKLDQRYADASRAVDELTTTWGRLPSLPASERPSPARLRADISGQLNQALNSRVFAHDEAVRMCDNVSRHYHKATSLLAKLKTMMDNYPSEGEVVKSPVEPKSPHMIRAKPMVRATGEDGQKIRRARVPRITVPGEVLAPYEIEYDTFSDDSDISSDDESEVPATTGRKTFAPTPRIKLNLTSSGSGGGGLKPPKITTTARVARPAGYPKPVISAAAAANALALLQPPPDNAIVGSTDAPWLQLTRYELAKLRKRMKKNATWTPSETMIARELKSLGRGPDAYRDAKKTAEDKGEVFDARVPAPVVDNESGARHLPDGAIGIDSLAAVEVPTSNRGMKLNEAKKLKREQLAKMAAEEAEESARKMQQTAKLLMGESVPPSLNVNVDANAKESSRPSAPKLRIGSRSQAKRKRGDAEGATNNGEATVESTEAAAAAAATTSTSATTSKPRAAKRSKTETPVPPPFPPGRSLSISAASDTSLPPSAVAAETPVPIPLPPQTSAAAIANPQAAATITGNVNSTPLLPPAKAPIETPVPLPKNDVPRTIPPPPLREVSARERTKRETRADVAKRTRQQAMPTTTSPSPSNPPPPLGIAPDQANKQSSSRNVTPETTTTTTTTITTTAVPEGTQPHTHAQFQTHPQPSLAADRPRRASTARNTPVPEIKPPPLPVKRSKRPAPGVVSTTNGGGNSAVGKRKAAPKTKARSSRKDKGTIATTTTAVTLAATAMGAATATATATATADVEMEEVDDEGNPIDPNEARYCLCNNVSFGTMIQCDNVDVSGTTTSRSSRKKGKKKKGYMKKWKKKLEKMKKAEEEEEEEEEEEGEGGETTSEQRLTTRQNCKQEWFHLECVGLSDIPARTTKWYCPDCRRVLNIGERGEVSARGVKK